MNEKFRLSRKVEVYDIIETRDVDTASSNIRDDQNVNFVLSKLCRVDFTSGRVEVGVDKRVGDVRLREELKEKILSNRNLAILSPLTIEINST